jgi:hypothetical protein
MTNTEELLAVARRIFWFGTPEEALEFPLRFLTYAMTYASGATMSKSQRIKLVGPR